MVGTTGREVGTGHWSRWMARLGCRSKLGSLGRKGTRSKSLNLCVINSASCRIALLLWKDSDYPWEGAFLVIARLEGRFRLHLKAFAFGEPNSGHSSCKEKRLLPLGLQSRYLLDFFPLIIPTDFTYYGGCFSKGWEDCCSGWHAAVAGRVFCKTSGQHWNVVPLLPLPCCRGELSEVPGVIIGDMRLEKTQEQDGGVQWMGGLCARKATSLTGPTLSVWHFAEEL